MNLSTKLTWCTCGVVNFGTNTGASADNVYFFIGLLADCESLPKEEQEYMLPGYQCQNNVITTYFQ